jgi:hypothetical protein
MSKFIPLFVVFEVDKLKAGDFVLAGNDLYWGSRPFDPKLVAGKRIEVTLLGGEVVETDVLEATFATALTGARNLFLRVRPLDSLREANKAIVCIENTILPAASISSAGT